jgi:hypothetical protein
VLDTAEGSGQPPDQELCGIVTLLGEIRWDRQTERQCENCMNVKLEFFVVWEEVW